MENFRDKDQQFVADWLVQQGLEKLVDVFKGMFSTFPMYCNPESHNFKASSESVNELWRFRNRPHLINYYRFF